MAPWKASAGFAVKAFVDFEVAAWVAAAPSLTSLYVNAVVKSGSAKKTVLPTASQSSLPAAAVGSSAGRAATSA
eukprot:jgi/Chrpa1/19393/Chrysochromulina_OHIO_Genome00003170-RA